MRLRLVHVLSLMLLAAVLLAVLAMGAMTAWNLRSGFADYLSDRDGERLEQFAQLVASHVEQAGSVQALREHPAALGGLMREFALREGMPDAAGPGPGPEADPGLPGIVLREGWASRRRGLPVDAAADTPSNAVSDTPPDAAVNAPGNTPDEPPPDAPPDARPGPLPIGPPGGPDAFGRRVMLADTEGRLLLGRPPPPGSAPWLERAVRVQGRTVAWARLMPLPAAGDAVEARFLRRQYLGLFGVATSLTLVALWGAWVVARRWARPLQAVQEATARIARGAFDVRLAPAGAGEIGDVLRNVNRMAEGLQRLEGSRRRWIADISHELRTPLAVLRGEIDSLVDGVRALRPAALLSLREEVLRLGAIVDDLHLLAMSDLQALPCHRAPCDAAHIVRRVAQRYAARAAERGLALQGDAAAGLTLPVHWDEGRIEQLLVNLLENSLRYTDAPGRISLGLHAQGRQVSLIVDDSAPGVAAADLPHLFDPLFRADAARSRERGGSGLGLAICAALARAHGGRVRAGASALGGLCVTVDLPADGQAA